MSATALAEQPESAVAVPDVPTSIQVTEGKVEFSEYGRPVAVMVADGNLLSAVLTPDGTVALATPSGNPTPLPVKIGDATGTLSAGGSITVSWRVRLWYLPYGRHHQHQEDQAVDHRSFRDHPRIDREFPEDLGAGQLQQRGYDRPCHIDQDMRGLPHPDECP